MHPPLLFDLAELRWLAGQSEYGPISGRTAADGRAVGSEATKGYTLTK